MAVTFVPGLSSGAWARLTGGWMFVVAVFPAVGVALFMTVVVLPGPRSGSIDSAAASA